MKNKGFTLIELLVVIVIISVLAVVVFVALNPVERFQDARDSRRWSDVNNVLTAVHECIVDNDGSFDDCLGIEDTDWVDDTTYEIVSDATTGCDDVCTGAALDTSCLDLDSTTDMAKYLKELPTDPGGVTSGHTEYSITVDSNNIVTIASCSAENMSVSVSR